MSSIPVPGLERTAVQPDLQPAVTPSRLGSAFGRFLKDMRPDLSLRTLGRNAATAATLGIFASPLALLVAHETSESEAVIGTTAAGNPAEVSLHGQMGDKDKIVLSTGGVFSVYDLMYGKFGEGAVVQSHDKATDRLIRRNMTELTKAGDKTTGNLTLGQVQDQQAFVRALEGPIDEVHNQTLGNFALTEGLLAGVAFAGMVLTGSKETRPTDHRKARVGAVLLGAAGLSVVIGAWGINDHNTGTEIVRVDNTPAQLYTVRTDSGTAAP